MYKRKAIKVKSQEDIIRAVASEHDYYVSQILWDSRIILFERKISMFTILFNKFVSFIKPKPKPKGSRFGTSSDSYSFVDAKIACLMELQQDFHEDNNLDKTSKHYINHILDQKINYIKKNEYSV